MDPRDVEHSYEGRDHVKKILDESPNPFLVSLGDLGESKDCTESKQLFAGTTECFKMVREFLDGFGHKYDIVGGNHDLEGIDEFATDKENLAAYLKYMGKETPQFCYEIAPKRSSSASARRSSATPRTPRTRWRWTRSSSTGSSRPWRSIRTRTGGRFSASRTPVIGSGLRVLQECHVVNGCCWLNHTTRWRPSSSSTPCARTRRSRAGSPRTSTCRTTTRTPSPSRAGTTAALRCSRRRA